MNSETSAQSPEPGAGSHTLLVPAEFDGQRLDRLLVALLGDYSRSRIQRLISDRHVELQRDGPRGPRTHEARANLVVREGDRVSVDLPAAAPSTVSSEALPLDILYQDADLAVLDKPAGMVVHPSAGHASGTVVNALLHHLDDLSGVGGELRPGIVHRLDRGTSGVMVVAKNDAAHHELARQFHDHEVEKEYIALVWGVVQAGRRIEAAIGRDPSNRLKMSTRASRARHAVTRITRAHHLPGLTLCQVAIHTGRTHQIRVHLSAIGHPIVGDATYGGVHRRVPGDIRAVQRLERPFLHAARLAFTHPGDGRRMQFIAPLPDDLTRGAGGPSRLAAGRQGRRMNEQPIVPTDIRTIFRGSRLHAARGNDSAPEGRRAAGRDRPASGLGRHHSDHRAKRDHPRATVSGRPSGRWAWELPAGSLKPGEDVEQAARRECHEETGYIPSRLERTGSYFPTPGYCDEQMTFFKATGLRTPGPATTKRIRTKTKTSRRARSRVTSSDG